MLKVVGAVVVYGLALYGLLEAIEKLDARWDDNRLVDRAGKAAGGAKAKDSGVSDPQPSGASTR